MKPLPRRNAEPAAPPDYRLLTFNVFLFLAGVGGIFFRMARDNDDLIRMVLVLSSGSALAYLLLAVRTTVPGSLAMACLGWASASLISSFTAFNPAESLKEFMKIAVYLVLLLTLAATARRRFNLNSRLLQVRVPAALLAAGFLLGLLHSRGWFGVPVGNFPYDIWTDEQCLASVTTALMLAAAFTLWLSHGTVRDAVTRGLWVMALSACVIGLFQFYSSDEVRWLDFLRPWDPRQPYDAHIRGWPPDIILFLQGILKGRIVLDGTEYVLVLPRILGIYGNPDFFAPYLLQFVPITVAAFLLDPGRRTTGLLMTIFLLAILLATQVWGAFLSLVMLAPFFGIIVGGASDPPEEHREAAPALRALGRRLAISLAAMVVLGVLGLLRLALVFVIPYMFYTSGRTLSQLIPGRRMQLIAATIAAGTLMVGGATWYLHTSGHKAEAIEERLVKYRMAAEMWRTSPIIGIGLNAYKTYYPRVQQRVRLQHGLPFESLGSSFTQENRTHNDIAQMLAETGVLGTGLFLWLMLALIYGAWRYLGRWRRVPPADRANAAGLLGGVLVLLFYSLPNFPFHIVSSAGTFWVVAALLASYVVETPPARHDQSPSPQSPEAPDPRRLRPLPALATVLTVMVTTVYGTRLFLGTLEYKRADNLARKYQPPDYRAAAGKYELALDYDPSNAQYAYDYGAMCFNIGDRIPELGGRAEDLLRLSLRLGFINEDLTYGLGHLAEQDGRYDEALRWFDMAVELNERKDPARHGRLRMLLRDLKEGEEAMSRGRYDRARRAFREALDRNPENHLAAHRLGALSVTPFGETADGLALLRRAAETARNEPSYYLVLGRALASTGRPREALVELERAALLDPNNKDIRAARDQVIKILETGAPAPH